MVNSSCESEPWWVYDDLTSCYRHRYTQLYPSVILTVISISILSFRTFDFFYKVRRKYSLRLFTPATDSERQALLSHQNDISSRYVESLDPISRDSEYAQKTISLSDIKPSFDPSSTQSFSITKTNDTKLISFSDPNLEDDNSSTLSSSLSSASLVNSQNDSKKLDRRHLSGLDPTEEITIITVTRSTTEYIRLLVELICNLGLAASSIAAFFIPSIFREWSSPAALVAIATLWTYSLTLISIRLFFVSRSIVPVVPLWAHSTTIYMFSFLFYLVTFRSAILHPISHYSQIFNLGQSLLVFALFLNNFTARIGDASARLYTRGSTFPSIEPISSIFSIISYSWIDPIIWIGFFRPLTAKDLWELKEDDHSIQIFEQWAKATVDSPISSSDGTTKKHRLAWCLFKCFSHSFIIIVTCSFLHALVSFGPPFLLKIILEYVDNPTDTPGSVIWLAAFSLLFCGLFSNMMNSRLLYVGRRLTIRVKAILISEIYKKTLRRKATVIKTSKSEEHDEEEEEYAAEDESQANHGAIINLMSVDSFEVSEVCAFFKDVFEGIFVTVMSIFFLYLIIGWSSFIGAGAMFLLMPIQFYLSHSYTKLQSKIMATTDRRIEKVNEVLQSIHIIKFFAWETKFSESIMETRREELQNLRERYVLWSKTILTYFLTPVIVTVLVFGSYIFIQKHLLTAPIAFTSLAILNVMKDPIQDMAEVITEILKAKVSLDRIEDFLNEKETSKYSQMSVFPTTGPKVRIGFQNATFSWESSDILNTSKTDFKLRDIDFDFDIGKLNVIIGPTGSGKTSLLLALLGEMELVSGSLYLPGGCLRDEAVPNTITGLAETVAYCSQSSWLLNDTVRNNILFGSDYDPKRFNAVVDACSLRRDLEIFDGGDQTEIGEKGVTLSGGQKQRVSLARAFYSNSRHLILDDCLSAVDSHTALWIYQHCLTGPLALNRTIILVSHNVALTISQASKVIVMDNGRVKAQGTPNVLLAQGHLGDDELTSASITRETSSTNLSSQANSSAPILDQTQIIPQTFGEEISRMLNKEPDPSILQEEEEEEEEQNKMKALGKLGADEFKQDGGVSSNVYFTYFKAMGGKYFWTFFILIYLLQPALEVAKSWWIKIWTQAITEKIPDMTVSQITQVVPVLHWELSSNYFISGATILDQNTHGSLYYMLMYVVLNIIFASFTTFTSLVSFFGSIRASSIMFKRLLDNILESKIRFFDSTPIGRIMNRFSKDMEDLDQELPNSTSMIVELVLNTLAIILLIVYITPKFLFFGIFILGLYWIIGVFYLSASREIKRLDSISRSPIFQHFGETLSGVSTIRAYGVSNRFISKNFVKVDNSNRVLFCLWTSNRWFSFRTEMTGSLVSFCSAAMIIISAKSLSSGLAGLSLSYALTFNDYIRLIIRTYSALEINMNSVERLLEYMNIEKEAPAVIEDFRPPKNWPSQGEIEVKDLSLRYAPELPLVIKNVSFKVPSFSKIGIVGRTGAGKSTIITAFFRFLEAETGYIKIDGIDISKIGLRDLRQNLAIIPQEPTLFKGTIRFNLDPFDQYSDKQIFEALRRVNLIKPQERPTSGFVSSQQGGFTSGVREGSRDTLINYSTPASTTWNREVNEENINLFQDLDTLVAEGGSNLSQGQRQLMCLARSLLKSPKVLLLDEATASIDYESDAQIQKTIRTEFSQTTIITIAHRLRSIVDYDRVLVMDSGCAVEYDHPHILLQNRESIFYSMCANSGELETLLNISRIAFEPKT